MAHVRVHVGGRALGTHSPTRIRGRCAGVHLEFAVIKACRLHRYVQRSRASSVLCSDQTLENLHVGHTSLKNEG
jgi:hypothetical protein